MHAWKRKNNAGRPMEIKTSGQAEERKALYHVIHSPVRSTNQDTALLRLFDRGLLRIQDGRFQPFNQLFKLACTEFLYGTKPQREQPSTQPMTAFIYVSIRANSSFVRASRALLAESLTIRAKLGASALGASSFHTRLSKRVISGPRP